MLVFSSVADLRSYWCFLYIFGASRCIKSEFDIKDANCHWFSCGTKPIATSNLNMSIVLDYTSNGLLL